MGTSTSIRVIAATLFAAAILGVAAAQTQNQAQQNQTQNQNQPQQTQPQKKKSFWDKIKESAAQGAQNTTQQGANAAQGAVQQGTNAVQNGAQQMQGGAQQGMQGAQQTAFPGAQGSGAFSGGGGGAGACGPSCFDAGPFQANVSQMTMSQQGAYHIIRMNVQFHNSTNQPLVIAYHEGSMVMVDNNGASYQGAGGQPGELQGMGIDRGNQTDSQFVLAPGQTGNALFSTARWRDQTSPIGTGYSYNLTIDELQTQNGAMAIPVRTYNLNFPTLAPSTVSSNAAFPGAGAAGNSYAGGGVMRPQGAAPASTGAQPRAVNAAATTRPGGAVSNAAMKSAISPTATKPSPVVKPVPAAGKTTAPAKKTTATTSTTTTSK
ncbi:MAG TPA: hypothetical protein VF011_21020 [Terriglobales bacterium]